MDENDNIHKGKVEIKPIYKAALLPLPPSLAGISELPVVKTLRRIGIVRFAFITHPRRNPENLFRRRLSPQVTVLYKSDSMEYCIDKGHASTI